MPDPIFKTYGAISVDQEPMRLPSRGSMTNVTINLNPQIVETANGIVAQEISGDQHMGPEAQQLLELIKQYGEKDARDLASSVHELEDTSAPTPGRFNARQKLKTFLIDVGDKARDVAASVLQSYVERNWVCKTSKELKQRVGVGSCNPTSLGARRACFQDCLQNSSAKTRRPLVHPPAYSPHEISNRGVIA